MKPRLGDDREAGDLLLGGPGSEVDGQGLSYAVGLTGGALSALTGAAQQRFAAAAAVDAGSGAATGGAPGRNPHVPVAKY